VWSKFPNLSAAEILHRMEATAIDKGAPGRDPVYGYGVIDPMAALTADVPPLTSPTPEASPSPLSSPSTQSAEALPGNPGTGIPLKLLAVSLGALIVIVIIVVAVVLSARRRRMTPPPYSGPPGGSAMSGPPTQPGG
jgi:hypothetical protein